jgi:hypothetical protein
LLLSLFSQDIPATWSASAFWPAIPYVTVSTDCVPGLIKTWINRQFEHFDRMVKIDWWTR